MISGLKVSQGSSPLLLKRITSIEFEIVMEEILANGNVGTRIYGPMNIT